MATLELRQNIAAPVETVWDAVVDWPVQSEWMLGTDVRVSKGDGASEGSQIAAYSGVRRLGFLDTMTITDWRPPHVCGVQHTGRVVRGTGVFEVRAQNSVGPETSVFIWREDLDLPLGVLGRAAWPVAKVPFAWGVRYSLRKLARYCEDRAR